jgi:hypothetical protein
MPWQKTTHRMFQSEYAPSPRMTREECIGRGVCPHPSRAPPLRSSAPLLPSAPLAHTNSSLQVWYQRCDDYHWIKAHVRSFNEDLVRACRVRVRVVRCGHAEVWQDTGMLEGIDETGEEWSEEVPVGSLFEAGQLRFVEGAKRGRPSNVDSCELVLVPETPPGKVRRKAHDASEELQMRTEKDLEVVDTPQLTVDKGASAARPRRCPQKGNFRYSPLLDGLSDRELRLAGEAGRAVRAKRLFSDCGEGSKCGTVDRQDECKACAFWERVEEWKRAGSIWDVDSESDDNIGAKSSSRDATRRHCSKCGIQGVDRQDECKACAFWERVAEWKRAGSIWDVDSESDDNIGAKSSSPA